MLCARAHPQRVERAWVARRREQAVVREALSGFQRSGFSSAHPQRVERARVAGRREQAVVREALSGFQRSGFSSAHPQRVERARVAGRREQAVVHEALSGFQCLGFARAHPQRVERARVARRREQAVVREVLLLLADRDQQADRRPAGLRRRVLRQRVHQVPHKQLRSVHTREAGRQHRWGPFLALVESWCTGLVCQVAFLKISCGWAAAAGAAPARPSGPPRTAAQRAHARGRASAQVGPLFWRWWSPGALDLSAKWHSLRSPAAGLRRRVLRQRVHQVPHEQLRTQRGQPCSAGEPTCTA